MSEPPTIFRKGDSVKITAAGRTVKGHVILASPCGKSLALEFEAILSLTGVLGGYAGMMPVMWNDELSRFEDLVCSEAIALERAPA